MSGRAKLFGVLLWLPLLSAPESLAQDRHVSAEFKPDCSASDCIQTGTKPLNEIRYASKAVEPGNLGGFHVRAENRAAHEGLNTFPHVGYSRSDRCRDIRSWSPAFEAETAKSGLEHKNGSGLANGNYIEAEGSNLSFSRFSPTGCKLSAAAPDQGRNKTALWAFNIGEPNGLNSLELGATGYPSKTFREHTVTAEHFLSLPQSSGTGIPAAGYTTFTTDQFHNWYNLTTDTGAGAFQTVLQIANLNTASGQGCGTGCFHQIAINVDGQTTYTTYNPGLFPLV